LPIRAAPRVRDSQHAEDRVPEDRDARDAESRAHGLQVLGKHVEGEIRDLARRPAGAPQVHEAELEMLVERRRDLALVWLRPDRAQHQTRRPATARGVVELGARDGDHHGARSMAGEHTPRRSWWGPGV